MSRDSNSVAYSRFFIRPIVVAVALAMASPLAYCQTPKRLSAWLLEQPKTPAPYPLGLSWRVPEEVPVQTVLRQDVLNGLAATDSGVALNPVAARRLFAWLSTLPATGRVPVALADARWLQANPSRDPLLLPGHVVVLPQRPNTVTVITGEGLRCNVPHAAHREVRAYLEVCEHSGASRPDWAWIAQPDGKVQRFGIAGWNEEKQDEPAPGAWIWAPGRESGWTQRFSEKLITFLATQGPAPDSFAEDVSGSDTTPRQEGASARGVENGGFTAPANGGIKNDQAKAAIEIKDPPAATASEGRGLQVTTSDWGNVGLLQMPTARMHPAGHFAFSYNKTYPYIFGNVFVQPFDWLEAGFRYTEISNRLYGPAELSGSQSAKDKSIDFKFKLWDESAVGPQLAVGIRDIGGTGRFGSEYLIASKRTGAFDWSLGAAWGYMAGHPHAGGNVEGGNFRFSQYFSGGARPFGGVQWQTPWEKWIVKVEYDSNDYQHEPDLNNQQRNSPINYGLVYRWGRVTDLTVGFERGNRITVGIALNSQLDGLSTPKLNDPPRVPVALTRPTNNPDWAEVANEISRQTDWHVEKIEQHAGQLTVFVDEADAAYWLERVNRAVAVLHRDAPGQIDRFVFRYQRRGIDTAEHVVDRRVWVAERVQPVPPSARTASLIAREPERARPEEQPADVRYSKPPSKFDQGLGLGYTYTLGGPDAFMLYQIYAQERVTYRFRDDTWVQGALRYRLIDNYDKFRFTGPSNLQRVRTFLREYLTTSNLTMPNLQLTHVGQITQNQYYSVYGGYLEEMFAGLGGEWLYRPFASRVALGVDVNQVKQRAFEQDFSFLSPAYSTTTGHATLYWDTGWNDLRAKISAGRYLAGDIGSTIDLSRVFRNGVILGGFMTKTNVSAAQFGEGSFDKGVYLEIPFDALFTKSTNSTAHVLWRPLTRDGGAMLARSNRLYDLTRARSDRTLTTVPAPAPNENVIPADRRENWQPATKGPEPYSRVSARPTADQWRLQPAHEYRMTEALYDQDFRNIQITYDGSQRLVISLANSRQYPPSRAVGRAARTALALAPVETREIRVTFAERVDPVVTYNFFDLDRLGRFFSGELKPSDLAAYVSVDYLNPAAREKDPLAGLGDTATDVGRGGIVAIVPETRVPGRVVGDIRDAAVRATDVNWLRFAALGAGTVLASAALDNRAFRFANDHADSSWLRKGVKIGNDIPWLALAGSAVLALDGSDPARSRASYAAVEAGATGLLLATGLKYAVGRARPAAGLGRTDFQNFSTDSDHQSFPSRHTVAAWAVATPYALEYNTWLPYGVAALTNLARVGSREHWVSDTVAGSLLGYAVGRIFWDSSRSTAKNEPRVMVNPKGVDVSWQF